MFSTSQLVAWTPPEENRSPQLSERHGVERAHALPSLDTLILIAEVLEVPISTLVESPTAGRKSRSRIREENEVFDLIRSLSNDQLRIARIQTEALRSMKK